MSLLERFFLLLDDKARPVFWLGLFFMVFWFFGAMLLDRPQDAGRGGAVVVALALAQYFINKREALSYYASAKSSLSALDDLHQVSASDRDNSQIKILSYKIEALEVRIQAHETASKHIVEIQRDQNLWMARSTFGGTIMLGFADIVANFILAHVR